MAKRTPAAVAPAAPPAASVPDTTLALAPARARTATSTLVAVNDVMMVPTYLALALVFVPVNWLTGRYSR
jgi:hypothetical protein